MVPERLDHRRPDESGDRRTYVYPDLEPGIPFQPGSGFTIGTDNNDYITRYLSNDYAVKWLNQATKAVQLGEKKVADGEAELYPYYKNVIQMARIWRAYLNSEVSDGFGPIPALDAFSGVPGSMTVWKRSIPLF